jgi:sulfite reductase alpha subunit-like flavoprotein
VRQEGAVNDDAALEYLKDLKSAGRYQRDVY